MKKAFSRLITFINHLLAYLVSTLVKRWLHKRVVISIIDRDDIVVIVKSESLNKQRVPDTGIKL